SSPVPHGTGLGSQSLTGSGKSHPIKSKQSAADERKPRRDANRAGAFGFYAEMCWLASARRN
ncbi:MAG: hypothetical protein WA197_06950, partial [Candidatus Acidiferrales bacterium]